MRGYKGMRHDMTCRGIKFEIGKTYHVNGDINICKNGLHFCEKLIDVLKFYCIIDNNRYFEVEADGVIKTDGIKSVASSLTIIRELKDIELYRAIYETGYGYGHGYSNSGDGNDYGYRYYGDGYCYTIGIDYAHGDDGYGNGYGNGYSNGYGDTYGNGSGNGYRYGHSYLKGIVKYV